MRRVTLLLAGLMLFGCGDARVGQLYRAERELWRTQEWREELPRVATGNLQLAAIAARYENMGLHYEQAAGEDSLGLKIRAAAARAWLSAAAAHLARMDSLRATAVLDETAFRVEGQPTIIAEMARLRGRLSESYGEYEEAIENYRRAVASVDPDPGATSVADSVHYLPRRIVQLAGVVTNEDRAGELDVWAQEYYDHWSASDSLDLQIDCRLLRARLDLDQQRWEDAIERFRELEQRMAQFELPRHDPADLAGSAFEARCQAWLESQADVAVLQTRFEDLREKYPDRDAVPEAMFSMALAARDRGLTEEALRLLSHLRISYGRARVAPQATLARARILESQGRWREAYVDYRLLQTEHPLTEAGLQVPLEIVRHHRGRGDFPAAFQALQRAEDRYRQILLRYPRGPHTYFTRQRLIETLLLAENHAAALQETLALAEDFRGGPRELALLVRASRIAEEDLDDPEQTRPILDRIVQRFPGTRTGQWAVRKLERSSTVREEG